VAIVDCNIRALQRSDDFPKNRERSERIHSDYEECEENKR
jgi:hypothetical protein